jgi:endonuclease/exonuclease/phosphatase (EEP) superfamily protein YafD
VYAPGNDPARLLDLIRETQPDIVLLQEVDAQWQAFLKPIESEYLHSMYCPRYAGGGPDLALFWNGESGEARELWPEDVPGASLQVDIDGQRVCLLNIHTAAPFTPVRARKYRQQMKLLREYANAKTTLLILAGDLNASPWSWEYKRLIADTSLKSVRNGMGLLGTWPSFFGPFRIALDHILITSEIQVSRCWTASGIGSDHLPLLVDLHVGMASR